MSKLNRSGTLIVPKPINIKDACSLFADKIRLMFVFHLAISKLAPASHKTLQRLKRSEKMSGRMVLQTREMFSFTFSPVHLHVDDFLGGLGSCDFCAANSK